MLKGLLSYVTEVGEFPEDIQIESQNIEDAKEVFLEALEKITDKFFYERAKAKGDYLNMGEILYDAQQGDKDAQFLLKLYDEIWKREEEIEKQVNQMSISELQRLNIKALAFKTFTQIEDEISLKDTGEK